MAEDNDGVEVAAADGVLRILLDRPARKNALPVAAVTKLVRTLEDAVDRRIAPGDRDRHDRLRLLRRRRLGVDQHAHEGLSGRSPTAHRQHPASHAAAGAPPDRAAHRGAAARGVRGAGLGRRARLPARPRRRLHGRHRHQPLLGAVPPAGVHPRQRRHVAAAPAGRHGASEGAAAARPRAVRPGGRRVGADPPGRPRRTSSTPPSTTSSPGSSPAPTVAVGLTKRCMHRAAGGLARRGDGGRGERAGADRRAPTDFKEGLAAFRDGRPPEFTGR